VLHGIDERAKALGKRRLGEIRHVMRCEPEGEAGSAAPTALITADFTRS
jgi:hypothetical protein